MTDKYLTQSPAGEFVMFASDDGDVRVECRFEQETLWLPQATIANLYQITPQAVTQHIKAIYEEGELEQNSTCKSYLQVQQEGSRQVSRNRLHYSLHLKKLRCFSKRSKINYILPVLVILPLNLSINVLMPANPIWG